MSNIKVELFFLRQFGFSNNMLERVWLNQESPLEISFSKNKSVHQKYHFSKKDLQLSNQQNEYQQFKVKFFLNEEFLKKNRSNKLFFKYDDTLLNNLIPLEIMPLFMYSKGNYKLLDRHEKRVAIIGTRNPSKESIEVAMEITKKFIDKDYIIVSGLAEGIDTVSHKTALINMGKTIAILPTNFKKIYPKKNSKLAEDIVKYGLLFSAIGPNENTYKSTFLERNQYIANMSDIVFVIETNLNSGTMNTIRNASEAKKKIIFIQQKDEAVNKKIEGYGGVKYNGINKISDYI